MQLLILYDLTDKEIVMSFRKEGSIAEILMAMDSAVKNSELIILGCNALLLSSSQIVDSEYLEDIMIAHICDIMRAYSTNGKTLGALALALSNLCYKKDVVKEMAIDNDVLNLIVSSSMSIDEPKLYRSCMILIRNLTSLPMVAELEESKVLLLSYIFPIIDIHVANATIVLNGLWSVLNLLRNSGHNKHAIIEQWLGLKLIASAIRTHKADEQIMEICMLLTQQLSKISQNRIELRKEGFIDIILEVIDIHSDIPEVLIPAMKTFYHLSFNKENRLILGKKVLKTILQPLTELKSDTLHYVISKLALRLMRESKNKEKLKNENAFGAFVTSIDMCGQRARATKYMALAMNELYSKSKYEDSDSDESSSDSNDDNSSDEIINSPPDDTSQNTILQAQLEDEIRLLKEQLNKANEKIQERDRTIEEFQETNVYLAKELENHRERENKLQEELIHAKAQQDVLNTELSDIKEQERQRIEEESKKFKDDNSIAVFGPSSGYIRKVKKRFQEKPDSYKSFIENTATINEVQGVLKSAFKNISEVMEGQDDLLIEFSSEFINHLLDTNGKQLKNDIPYDVPFKDGTYESCKSSIDLIRCMELPGNFLASMESSLSFLKIKDCKTCFSIFDHYLSTYVLNVKLDLELQSRDI